MTMQGMTREELLALPATVSLLTAGRALGMSRTITYDLATRGEFPCKVLRLGSRYKVVTEDLLRVLGVSRAGSGEAAPDLPSPVEALGQMLTETLQLQMAMRRILHVVDQRVKRYEDMYLKVGGQMTAEMQHEAGPELFKP